MTLKRTNLAGITTRQLRELLVLGDPFFVRTQFVNLTRQLLQSVKTKYGLRATTKQVEGGLWIYPEKEEQ